MGEESSSQKRMGEEWKSLREVLDGIEGKQEQMPVFMYTG